MGEGVFLAWVTHTSGLVNTMAILAEVFSRFLQIMLAKCTEWN
jgi:hypothetical protein